MAPVDSPNQSTSRRLGRNFVLLVGGNLSGQLLAFVGLAHLARILGPAGFGLWNLAQAWMLYLLRGGEMGLEVIGIRTIARDRTALRQHTWNIVITRVFLAIALLGFMVGISVTGLLPPGSSTLVLLFSLAVFPTALVVEWVFESQQSVGVVAIARFVKGLVFFGLVIVFITDPSQIVSSIHFYNVSLVVSAVLVIVLAQRRFSLLPPTYDIRQARSLLREGLPIGVSTLLSQYALFTGTIVLGYVASEQELGYYTAAHRLIVFFWAYGIVTSNRIVLPQLSTLYSQSRPRFVDFILKYTRLLATASMPVVIVATAAGKEIVTMLFGGDYEPAAGVFRVLSAAFVVGIVRSALETGLIASDRQKRQTLGMAGLAVLSTALTYAFYGSWGILGAAWAMVIAETLYAVYLVVAFEYVSIIHVLTKIWKPVIVTIAIVGAFLVFDVDRALTLGLVGLLAYGVLLWVMSGITRADVALVRSIAGIPGPTRPDTPRQEM